MFLSKLLTIIILFLSITLSLANNVYAQAQVGECCGGAYEPCDGASGLSCDQPATQSQCPNNLQRGIPVADFLTCRAGTVGTPNFVLPWYGIGGIPMGQFWKWPARPSGIGAISSELLPYVYAIAGLLLFAYLLYGGFHLASSFGSPKAILEAWQIIFRALVGFALVFSTFWLLRLIETIFGICILGNCT